MGILDNIRGDGELQSEKGLAVKRDEALDQKVDSIMQSYGSWLAAHEGYPSPDKRYKIACGLLQGSMVDQFMMDEFMMRLRRYPDKKHFEDSGLFLSAMVQNAYDAGDNGLLVKTGYLEHDLGRIGAYLSGSEKRRLSLRISGSVADDCGQYARHSDIIIEGDAGRYCGSWAHDSAFLIRGDVLYWCGLNAEKSRFDISGSVKNFWAVKAIESTFILRADAEIAPEIKGSILTEADVGRLCQRPASYMKRCTIMSPKIDVLRSVMRRMTSVGSRFYLLKPDGTEEEVPR